MSTVPSGSSVGGPPLNPSPAAVQDPLPGSYISATNRQLLGAVASYVTPPVSSTLPSCSSVAVPLANGVAVLPVAVQDRLPGSYSSADMPLALSPPATSTLPSGSSVAVWPLRASIIDPPALHPGILGVGEDMMAGLGDSSPGDGVGMTATEGTGPGGTDNGSRSRPEPTAAAPPTSNRAAAARRVIPRPRPNRRAGRDGVRGIAATSFRSDGDAVSPSSTSARYHAWRRPSSSRSVIARFLCCRRRRSPRAAA
jgi:hypothetical protein